MWDIIEKFLVDLHYAVADVMRLNDDDEDEDET
jgi:hypothetical protein